MKITGTDSIPRARRSLAGERYGLSSSPTSATQALIGNGRIEIPMSSVARPSAAT